MSGIRMETSEKWWKPSKSGSRTGRYRWKPVKMGGEHLETGENELKQVKSVENKWKTDGNWVGTGANRLMLYK